LEVNLNEHSTLTRKAIREAGSQLKLAAKLKIAGGTVQSWAEGKRRVPPLRALQLQALYPHIVSFREFYPKALDI